MERVQKNICFANLANMQYNYPKNIKKRIYRQRKNYLHFYNEEDFKKRFRLSKSTFSFVLKEIEHKIKLNTMRNRALCPAEQLFLALRFYASGNFLITAGDFCGVSVPTASRVVKRVSLAIAELFHKFIKMPETEDERNNSKVSFHKIARFPKVIGCIDCTHVRIQSPGGDNAEIYRNRKGYFSFNVQAVCNSNLQFIDLVCRWPGSTHDSNIFNNSRLRARLDNHEFNNCFLLGDSGYAVGENMMVPLLNPRTDAEQLYNESQIRTRNCIERCFGAWKRRFPALYLGMRLHYKTVMLVVSACAVLHNIARMNNEALPEEEEENSNEFLPNDDQLETDAQTDVYSATRSSLIMDYFAR